MKLKEAVAPPQFDYRNLHGEEFKRYDEYINSLPWNDKKEFELYPAEGQFKLRLNDRTLEKEKFLNGIRLKDMQPKHTTLITVLQAKDLNSQIEQNSIAGTGFYYLLKQTSDVK